MTSLKVIYGIVDLSFSASAPFVTRSPPLVLCHPAPLQYPSLFIAIYLSLGLLLSLARFDVFAYYLDLSIKNRNSVSDIP